MTLKNGIYRAALSLARPVVNAGRTLAPKGSAPALARILNRHAVLSGVVHCGEQVYTLGRCDEGAFFRTASLSKLVTAIGVLKMVQMHALSLDTRVADITPLKLQDITLRQLLSHTSGLIDGHAYHAALNSPAPLDTLIARPAMREDSHCFCYSNLGFGILGAVIEYVTGYCLENWMRENVFKPLQLSCTYDITRLQTAVDSWRLIPPQKAFDARKRKLAASPLDAPDPQHHYTLAAGNLFSDAASIERILHLIAHDGEGFLPAEMIQEMKTPQAAYGELSPTLQYGLGLLIVNDPGIAPETLYGHQGFAYGSVNGAFFSDTTKKCLVSLNSGASELRQGRMGCMNQDLLKWAFGG